MVENQYYSNNLGAIHALKGYHHQFLYSLLRILKGTEQEHGFFPEGKYEDLDIYGSKNNVIEIIQIKSLKSTLTLSDILSAKDSSFIKRALSICTDTTTPKIKLLSFGEANDDIINLANSKYSPQFIAKLKSKGLKATEISILEKYFEYEIVSEQSVSNDLLAEIERIGLFSDLKTTLDLFVYWIYNAARAQLKLNKNILTEELLKIGKFQSERNNFIKHFGSLIKPLLNEEIDTKTQNKLKEDFYKGISAEYEHILANADVIRDKKLEEINHKYQKSDVVFIHGASGQGKSTLAYRYLFNYCGNTKDFFATVQNKLHWAITGKTAAEIIYTSADATKLYMGLTNWKQAPEGKILKSDVTTAKNYLNEAHIRELNRIVSAYLDLAENRAERGITTSMQEWGSFLNQFLELSQYPILQDKGRISALEAKLKAEQEYETFRKIQDHYYLSDFDKEVKRIKGKDSK